MLQIPRLASRSGFGLVEVLVVISIIGLLAGIILPNYLDARRQAHDTDRFQFAMELKKALTRYYIDNRYYPDDNFSDRTCQILGVGINTTDTYDPWQRHNQTCMQDIEVASFAPDIGGLFEVFPDPLHDVHNPGIPNSKSEYGIQYLGYVSHYTDPDFVSGQGMQYCSDRSEYVIYVPLAQEDGVEDIAYCYIHSSDSDDFSINSAPVTPPANGVAGGCTEGHFKFWIPSGSESWGRIGTDWDGDGNNNVNYQANVIGSCKEYFAD